MKPIARAVAAWICAGALVILAGCAGAGRERRQNDVEQLREIRERELNGLGDGGGESSDPVAPVAPMPPDRKPTERPAWAATGIAREYPLDRYIVGIGSAHRIKGDDHAAMTSSDGRARGEIAKTIQVRITAEFRDAAELITQLREGEYATEKHRTSVAEQITSATDIVLEGVVIMDRWYDADSETWWSLAVMERESAGRAILDRMARRTGEFRAVLTLAKESDDQKKEFQALGYHNAALKEMLKLLNLRAQLRAVAPSLVPKALMPEDTTLADVVKEAISAGERVRFGVLVSVSAPDLKVSAEPVQAEMERGLRALGLKIVRVNGKAVGSAEDVRAKPAAELAEVFGVEADALLVATFAGKEVARERMVNMEAHFWQARGDAVIVDLDAQRVVSSAGFDYLPATHTGMPNVQNAAEGALKRAAQEMLERLRKELAADLNVAE
jgi:hypothetical protein